MRVIVPVGIEAEFWDEWQQDSDEPEAGPETLRATAPLVGGGIACTSQFLGDLAVSERDWQDDLALELYAAANGYALVSNHVQHSRPALESSAVSLDGTSISAVQFRLDPYIALGFVARPQIFSGIFRAVGAPSDFKSVWPRLATGSLRSSDRDRSYHQFSEKLCAKQISLLLRDLIARGDLTSDQCGGAANFRTRMDIILK